jgi:hypothetical protein
MLGPLERAYLIRGEDRGTGAQSLHPPTFDSSLCQKFLQRASSIRKLLMDSSFAAVLEKFC